MNAWSRKLLFAGGCSAALFVMQAKGQPVILPRVGAPTSEVVESLAMTAVAKSHLSAGQTRVSADGKSAQTVVAIDGYRTCMDQLVMVNRTGWEQTGQMWQVIDVNCK